MNMPKHKMKSPYKNRHTINLQISFQNFDTKIAAFEADILSFKSQI